MPDRILRNELLTSEAWLSLKNNDDRVCWITLLLNADTLGNQPAGSYRLIHIWRYAGIDTPEKVAKVLAELSDSDLIRLYHFDEKLYVHIPRFRQSRRFLGKLWPIPPWATYEDKQAVEKKSPVNHVSPPVVHGESPHGVGVGVGVGVDVKSNTLSSNLDAAREILQYLNQKLGKNFRPVKSNLGLIEARLKEKVTPAEIMAVIDAKIKEWKYDDTMSEYLRPLTLFNASKFHQYLGEIPL